MPKVSVNILTKNRAEFLKKTLQSLLSQTKPKILWQDGDKKNIFDIEVLVVNDGSTDNTKEVISEFKSKFSNLNEINHPESLGIIRSRQECLLKSNGEYIALLDDDDNWGLWADTRKLEKQIKFLDSHVDYVLVGGCMQVGNKNKFNKILTRPRYDWQIRLTMLFRNNFFTSTVMFRRSAALRVGGFVQDEIDLAEDYDLWLRLGHVGKMYNFQRDSGSTDNMPFVYYQKPSYNKVKLLKFFEKQLKLIKREKDFYFGFFLANMILKLRIFVINIFS